MWEQQFDSMVAADHLDQEAICDLGITYVAETGDESMLEAPFVAALHPIFLPHRLMYRGREGRKWVQLPHPVTGKGDER
jgi:hypothetical protein